MRSLLVCKVAVFTKAGRRRKKHNVRVYRLHLNTGSVNKTLNLGSFSDYFGKCSCLFLFSFFFSPCDNQKKAAPLIKQLGKMKDLQKITRGDTRWSSDSLKTGVKVMFNLVLQLKEKAVGAFPSTQETFLITKHSFQFIETAKMLQPCWLHWNK